MENNNYWDNPEYNEVIKNYSEYRQMCGSLNEYDPKDQWAFEKRDLYLRKASRIKNKLISENNQDISNI